MYYWLIIYCNYSLALALNQFFQILNLTTKKGKLVR